MYHTKQIIYSFTLQLLLIVSLLGITKEMNAATHFFTADQLPEGTTLEELGLGERPFGAENRSVRLVEFAELPGAGQLQQIVPRGDSLFVVLKEGRIWEFDLSGNQASEPFLDIPSLRPLFNDYSGWAASRGLRGFAFHPEFDTNGLVYTMHKEDSDGSTPDYGTTHLHSEFILAEWNFNDLDEDLPRFRQLFRVRFEHDWHTAQQIKFNPHALPGDPDYGLIYACFGDNGGSTNGSTVLSTAQLREVSDISNVGQDFTTIHSSIIRIDPLDPSSYSDPELAEQNRIRSDNGNFSIPLDNPFIDHPSYRNEIFAKGFRNPLTISFSPGGRAVIADVGEQAMEEINVLESGGNYGWPVRDGTFLVAFADQIDGAPLGADASMQWLPHGSPEDPARSFYVRDKDQNNLRTELLALTGPYADGFVYPVFQFSHEGNNTNDQLSGLAAIVGGDYYSGFWAEELRGIYLFANLSTDQLFYGALSALDDGSINAEVKQLPLVDMEGNPTSFASIVGNIRGNPRFGRDRHGNLYIGSKTNRKLYRLQGTPRMEFATTTSVADGPDNYFEFTVKQPPEDDTIQYQLLATTDLLAGFQSLDSSEYTIINSQTTDDGRQKLRIRLSQPIDPTQPRFFKIRASPLR